MSTGSASPNRPSSPKSQQSFSMQRIFPISDPPSQDLAKYDITDEACSCVSTCHPEHGADELFSPSPLEYWQSSASYFPHNILLQFNKKRNIQQVSLFLGGKRDFFFNPRMIMVRAGNHGHSMREVARGELEEDGGEKEPRGWYHIRMRTLNVRGEEVDYVRVMNISIDFLGGIEDQRNVRVRGCRVFERRSFEKYEPYGFEGNQFKWYEKFMV